MSAKRNRHRQPFSDRELAEGPALVWGNRRLMDSRQDMGQSKPSVAAPLRAWQNHRGRLSDSSRRFRNWLTDCFTRLPKTGQTTANTVIPPQITTLEQRIVLNATAELSAITGLSILGDAADDHVQLVSLNGGTEVQLLDSIGNVIPITGHTGGATGNETDPLAVSDIAGGQVTIDLGQGDDLMQIDLPDGIHLDLIDDDGQDRTELQIEPIASPSPRTTVNLHSESIELISTGALLQLADRDVTLIGDVAVGAGNPGGLTQVDVGDGSLSINGSLTINSNLRLFGDAGDVDLSNAVVSASSSGLDLFVEFGSATLSKIEFGTLDSSAGHLLDDVQVVSATQTDFSSSIEIDGDLEIQTQDSIQFHDRVAAASIESESDQISVAGDLETRVGSIALTGTSSLTVEADITTIGGSAGTINLNANAIQLENASLSTEGGDVLLSGDSILSGNVSVNTATSPATSIAGDVDWFGTIQSAGLTNTTLVIDSNASSISGNVSLTGNIGGASAGSSEDLNAFIIDADTITVGNVGVEQGPIQFTADSIFLSGGLIRSSDDSQSGGGTIDIDGNVTFQFSASTLHAASTLSLSGTMQTSNVNHDVTIESDDQISIAGSLDGGDRLVINAFQTIGLDATVDQWQSIQLVAPGSISVSSNVLRASSDIHIADAIVFQEDSLIEAATVQIDESISVSANKTVSLDAVLVDADTASAIEKLGDGELIFAQTNTSTTDLNVRSGAIRVDGSLNAGSVVTVDGDASIHGDGLVNGNLVINGGTLAPSHSGTATDIGQLTAGSLTFLSQGIYQVDVDGSTAGQQLDSTAIQSQPIDLTGALLELDITTTLPGDTELLILSNDSNGDLTGRFFASFDENGNPLGTPRELVEGALVLNQFGPGPTAVAAYITYFGGDGNDVTIVTAGDSTHSVDNVTLVDRVGVNIHIRTGSTYQDAENATPSIRPISGVNGNTLTISPNGPSAELYVDIDGFVDTGPNSLHFDADIRFDTTSVGGQASVTLYDSDRTSLDSPLQFAQQFSSALDSTLDFNHAPATAPSYQVQLAGVSSIDLDLPSDLMTIQLTLDADSVTVDADTDADTSVVQITTNAETSSLRLEQPQQQLLMDGSQGDDFFHFRSFGSDLIAVPQIVGGDGDDVIAWDADVTVGTVSTAYSLLIDAESVSINGDIDLIGGGTLQINAATDLGVTSIIDVIDGQITIRSDAAMSDLSQGTLISTAVLDSIRLQGESYRLGDLRAVNGEITLGTSTPGNAIAAVSQALGTSIETLQLDAFSVSNLTLDSVDNELSVVNLTATGTVDVFDSLDDLQTMVVAGGDVDLQTAGHLHVESIESTGGATNIQTAGNLIGLGTVSPFHLAGSQVMLAVGVPYPGLGNIPGVMAEIGTLAVPIRISASQQIDATTSGTDGSIFINAPTTESLRVGLIDSGDGSLRLVGEQIDDAIPAQSFNLVGADIELIAQTGIGQNATLRATALDSLTATTVTGTVRVDLTADRTITLTDIDTGGGIGSEVRIQHTGDHRLALSQIANADGDVLVTTDSGSVDVLHGASPTVFAGANGQIQIETGGTSSDLIIRGAIQNELGDAQFSSGRNLVLTADGSIHSDDGVVRLTSGTSAGQTSATLAMTDGAMIEVSAGQAILQSQGDVQISSIRSSNSGDAIEILSTFGSLIDSGDSHTDLVADMGIVRLDVASGIGSSDPIESQIGQLFATARDSGAIRIDEVSDLVLRDVSTGNGEIQIQANGDLLAEQVTSFNTDQLDATADIHLTTTGTLSDLLIGTLKGHNVADVSLSAGDDVLNQNMGSLLTADDLTIEALNGNDDSNEAIRLNTAINDLHATVLGSFRGDIQITEVDSVFLASSDSANDLEVLQTTNGEIRVFAGSDLVVNDAALVDDGSNRRSDFEIIAGGDHGRISLNSATKILIGDSSQIRADQSTAAAITIESPAVEFGDQIQIESGQEGSTNSPIAVARVFSLRPDQNVTDTAFYDYTTIHTNRLEQAAVNDALGILTVDIGTAGERGLTINIDWGAESNRFQQIDLLSGDAAPLQVPHLYLEDDIIDARFNGRDSATDPLEVRFSVRHHESILVTGQTVQQAGGPIEMVEGELISSTDNPTTSESPGIPKLENGEARFVIPALSIPVAFFPVRDVIPIVEQESLVLSTQQSFTVLGGSFETETVLSSNSTGRDEYFQIRVLSPDPSEADLVPPSRLPDDIIGGDRLKQLFESLPDGHYEIEYVLGDSTVRSILSVDLRDGKPIVTHDDADSGTLRLEPIVEPDLPQDEHDLESVDRDQNEPREIVPESSDHPDPNDKAMIRIDPTATGRKINPPIGRLSTAGRMMQRMLDHAESTAEMVERR